MTPILAERVNRQGESYASHVYSCHSLSVGMVLNSTGLSFDQPQSSSEQDPAKRSAAEADAYRRFFDVQRKQAIKRQARVGQYAWLLMAAIIGSFIWLYK